MANPFEIKSGYQIDLSGAERQREREKADKASTTKKLSSAGKALAEKLGFSKKKKKKKKETEAPSESDSE